MPGTNEDAQPVRCVIIHGGQLRYSASTVKPSDPIFNNTPLPISTKIGFPLVMYRKIDGLPFGQETDNVHATWLNINPVDGFAPQYLQGGIGDVVVAKADGNALTVDELAGVVDYVSAILDARSERAARLCTCTRGAFWISTWDNEMSRKDWRKSSLSSRRSTYYRFQPLFARSIPLVGNGCPSGREGFDRRIITFDPRLIAVYYRDSAIYSMLSY
jgi:hypothetical protein